MRRDISVPVHDMAFDTYAKQCPYHMLLLGGSAERSVATNCSDQRLGLSGTLVSCATWLPQEALYKLRVKWPFLFG